MGAEQKVAIITGASQGIGEALAREYWNRNYRIVATARSIKPSSDPGILAVAGDIADPTTAERVVSQALERFGRIDTLVNNAAALIRLKLVDFTEELLQKAVRWNVWNTLRCCKAVLPHMIERQYGRIVNIGGEAWRTGAPYHTLLAGIGKGSMVGLTATLAGEVVRYGITVNCVSPGGIETDADGAKELLPPGFREPDWTDPEFFAEMRRMGGGRGIGRMAHPTEVAAAVAFFGAPEASFVTGQHLGASGGVAML